NEMESKSFEVVLLDFIDVAFVFGAEYYLTNTAAFGGKYFLFDSADRQNLSAQGNFSRHCQPRFYFALRVDGSKRSKNSYPCRRTVFWNCTCGYVDMKVVLLKDAMVDQEALRVGFQI